MKKTIASNSNHSSTKSTDSKKNICKKLSNAKLINGICNTAFTLEEKLQGYSNFKNSEDAKSSDEDATANTSTVNSTLNSPNIDENQISKFETTAAAAKQKQDNFSKQCLESECKNYQKQQLDFKSLDEYDKNDNNKFVNSDKYVCDTCFVENHEKTNDKPRKNSDLKQAVQNLSCGLNILASNSSARKCCKCTNLPDYAQQLSNSSSDKSLKSNHQNGFNSSCSAQNGTINSHFINNNIEHIEHGIVDMPNTTNQTLTPNKLWSALKGVLLAFLSSVFFSLTTVIVKHVKEIDAGQMAIYRFAGMLLFVLPIVADNKTAIFGPSNKRHWVLLRGLAGASSLYLRYSTLHYLPISNATVCLVRSLCLYNFINFQLIFTHTGNCFIYAHFCLYIRQNILKRSIWCFSLYRSRRHLNWYCIHIQITCDFRFR